MMMRKTSSHCCMILLSRHLDTISSSLSCLLCQHYPLLTRTAVDRDHNMLGNEGPVFMIFEF